MLKSVVIGLAVGFTATAAIAAGPRALGVWDGAGQFVGDLTGAGEVLVNPSAALGFEPDGTFFGVSAFYFTSNDCSGTAYIISNSLPAEGAVVSGSLFYPAHPEKIALGSWALANGAGGCNKAPQTQWAGVATQAPLPKVTPPLCVSPTKIRCQ